MSEGKICPKCDPPQWKPLEQFHRRSRSPDGRQSYCKRCQTKLVMQTRDPVKNRACVLRWMAKNPERVRTARARWYQRHRDERVAYAVRYRELHGDAIRAKNREWYYRNRAYVAAYHKANVWRWRERINAAARRRYWAKKLASAKPPAA